MLYSQETKYDVEAGRLVNRETRVPIPDHEPVFVLRAKDLKASAALIAYHAVCTDPNHRKAIAGRIDAFNAFAADHPEAMKEPDSPRGSGA